MRLNKSGIYNVIGPEWELIVRVIGEIPTLRIHSGIRINDFVKTGKVVALNEESLEIQQLYNRPEDFIFNEIRFSEISEFPIESRSIHGKVPDLSEDLYKEFCNRYMQDAVIPGRGSFSTKVYIQEKTGWTLSQCSTLLLQIQRRVKLKPDNYGRV